MDLGGYPPLFRGSVSDAEGGGFRDRNYLCKDMERNETKPRYWDRVSPRRANLLAAQIKDILVGKEQFMNPDLCAAELCRDLKISRPVLAAVMQLQFNGNFARVVGRMRVERAKVMMKDPRNAPLTCEEIGLMVGYKSRQSFYNAFGREEKMTPLKYRTSFGVVPRSMLGNGRDGA